MKIYIKLFFLTILLFFANTIHAINDDRITIIGNKNIDNEIIFSIIKDTITDYSDNNLNQIIKTLYNTGNFKDIKIEKKENNFIIKITENPPVDKITFNGNKRFKDNEILEIFEKEKFFRTYNEYSINNFIINLKKLYSSFGYNIMEIEYEVIKKAEEIELVDLIFNITEGNISKVNRIYFIGNDSYTDAKIRSVIKTKQRNYLRLSRASNYKSYQIKEDLGRLLNFYKFGGFRDVKIDIKDEFIKEKNKLNIYFYINEGDQYYFGNIDFDIADLNMNEEIVNKIINDEQTKLSKILLKDNIYNPEIYDQSKNRLTKSFYKNGKSFFKINVLEKRHKNNDIDIMFKIYDVIPQYVNNINIYGNTRTKEKVIRREISFAEGDPYNDEQLGMSKSNLQRLGFFKSIDITDEKNNDDLDINVTVEEKSTGEFNVGVGIDSYEGATFTTGLKEKNIFGDGRELNLNVNTSSNNTVYSFGVIEPYIFNQKIDLIYNASYLFKDRSDSRSYDLEEFNTALGIRYELTEKVKHSVILQYKLKDYEITNSSASNSIKKLGGNNADILLENKINYNEIDSFIRPSKGTSASFNNIFSPSTNDDNGYIKNTLNYSKYYPYKRKNIFSIKTKIGNIYSLQNKEIPVEDKFSLGGRWLRGFDSFGVGPRESRSSYVGGQNIIVAKIDLDRPISGSTDNPIDLNLFTDIGTVFSNKVDPSQSEESIRASYGFGIKFYSPIGPIGFSWGFPIMKESHDIERMFTFSVGLVN